MKKIKSLVLILFFVFCGCIVNAQGIFENNAYLLVEYPPGAGEVRVNASSKCFVQVEPYGFFWDSFSFTKTAPRDIFNFNYPPHKYLLFSFPYMDIRIIFETFIGVYIYEKRIHDGLCYYASPEDFYFVPRNSGISTGSNEL